MVNNFFTKYKDRSAKQGLCIVLQALLEQHRLSHFSKLAELLQIEREWYIEIMNAWAETMVNAWAELRIST